MVKGEVAPEAAMIVHKHLPEREPEPWGWLFLRVVAFAALTLAALAAIKLAG